MFWNWTCLTWFKLPFCFHTSKIFPHGHQFQGNYSLTVHGMNQLELMANSRASQRFTRNFNEDPSLRELSTGSFDAVPPRQWSCGAWWFGGSVRRRIHGGTSSPCKTKIFFLKSWMVGRWKSMSEIPKWSRLFRGHLHFRGSILHWFWKWLRLFVSCPGSSMKFQWSWGHGRWGKKQFRNFAPQTCRFFVHKTLPRFLWLFRFNTCNDQWTSCGKLFGFWNLVVFSSSAFPIACSSPKPLKCGAHSEIWRAWWIWYLTIFGKLAVNAMIFFRCMCFFCFPKCDATLYLQIVLCFFCCEFCSVF